KGFQTFAETLRAAHGGSAAAPARLHALADDNAAPDIARATAISELGRHGGAEADAVIARALSHSNALIRRSALAALSGADAATRVRLAVPLLSDPVRAVRMEAASLLADTPPALLDARQRAALDRALSEYVEAQRLNADRADGRLNLASLYARQGHYEQAEQEYRAAIRIEPQFVPAYVNLADMYRSRDKDAESEKVLREGLREVPDNAELHHSLGLALARQKHLPEALAELRRAAVLAPESA